jgi:hypothetical protein
MRLDFYYHGSTTGAAQIPGYPVPINSPIAVVIACRQWRQDSNPLDPLVPFVQKRYVFLMDISGTNATIMAYIMKSSGQVSLVEWRGIHLLSPGVRDQFYWLQ